MTALDAGASEGLSEGADIAKRLNPELKIHLINISQTSLGRLLHCHMIVDSINGVPVEHTPAPSNRSTGSDNSSIAKSKHSSGHSSVRSRHTGDSSKHSSRRSSKHSKKSEGNHSHVSSNRSTVAPADITLDVEVDVEMKTVAAADEALTDL